MDQRHAPEPRRGEEAGRVAERPAADRNQWFVASRPHAGQLARRLLDDRQPLRGLAFREHDLLDRPAVGREAFGDRSPRGRPGTRLGDEDRAPGLGVAERGANLRGRDPLADYDVPARRVGPQEDGAGAGHWLRARARSRGELIDPIDEGPHLRRAVEPMTCRVEPLALPGEAADRPDRIAPGDERPDVRAPTKSLGEDLRPAVEPDREAAAVQRPPVPGVHDRAAAGRHDPPDRRLRIGRPEILDRRPFHRPEGRLALLGKDLRDLAAGRALDRLVEVDVRGVVAMGEPPPDGALAAAGQPDEHDVHRS